MSRTERRSSRRRASKGGRFLADPDADPDAKSFAGPTLTQAPDRAWRDRRRQRRRRLARHYGEGN